MLVSLSFPGRQFVESICRRGSATVVAATSVRSPPPSGNSEVGDPRYIVDLLARIVTVSFKTMQIVDGLPSLAIHLDPGLSRWQWLVKWFLARVPLARLR